MDISGGNTVAFNQLGHAYRENAWIFRGYRGAVGKGEVLAILGPNGRGKTTLLKVLLGALRPREGSLHVVGEMAFVPQLMQVSFDFTCLDMVLMGRARKVGFFARPKESDEDAARAALVRLGIGDYAERSFQQLSGGQRQLVIIARAIAADAQILMLDEPTSALDLENQQLVLRWVDTLAHEQGLTVLMTTHHPHHALAVADQVLLMKGGESFESGPAEKILTKEALSDLYRVPIERVAYQYAGRALETLVPVLDFDQRRSLAETEPARLSTGRSRWV